MPRLFGTDGIRGIANIDLKPTLALLWGGPPRSHLGVSGGALVIGQDTRRSGDMFVAALAAGATCLGSMSTSWGRPHAGPGLPRRPWHVRRGDHGLGLAQPCRRQRPEGARRFTVSSSTTPSRRSSSS